jgi:glycosyltransferase involved in cell wall biosynthesis
MRLGLITHNYPFSKEGEGQATAGLFVHSFAHALRDAGIEVFVFTAQIGGLNGESDLEVKWFPWKGNKKLGRLNLFNPKEMKLLIQYLHNGRKELFDYIKEKKIEHCLAFWAFPSGYFARLVKEKLGIPYTVWALGSDIWTYSRRPVLKGLIKKILISADYVYADGLKLCEDVRALSNAECAFLPTTRDLPCAASDTGFHPALNIIQRQPPDITKFLYIGRFDRIKGVDILFEAVRRLKQRTGDFHLFAFGGGELYERMKLNSSKWKLDKEVTIGGYINAGEAAKFLYSCDCMIIPSRKESIPLIYSDGLKAGISMITSDVGDLGELFRKYHYGKIFPSENIASLEEALFSFIQKRKSGEKKDSPPEVLLNLFTQKRIVSELISLSLGGKEGRNKEAGGKGVI